MKRIPFKWVVTENGCFECISHCLSGHPIKYPVFSYLGNRYQIHRYIYEQSFGEIAESLVVRHKCDNPICINPEHLELGTRADNNRDRVERNRSAIGIKHGRSKLSEKEVISILMSNEKQQVLADRYKVARAQIYKIKNFITWKHVTGNLNKVNT